jgi:hypothetical protein
MEKLSRLRVPPEWETAFIACLDRPPTRPRGRRGWAACLLLALAGCVAFVLWLIR